MHLLTLMVLLHNHPLKQMCLKFRRCLTLLLTKADYEENIIYNLHRVSRFGNAQVGINTPSPTNTLDVNGDLNIAKELRTGGTDLLKGSAGTAGYILHNNAALGSNDWKDIKIADGQGSMSVFSMNTVEDKTGISFTGDGLLLLIVMGMLCPLMVGLLFPEQQIHSR
jgi:hypothetical protein